MPNDVQRSFHLMRELDKDAAELQGSVSSVNPSIHRPGYTDRQGMPWTGLLPESVQQLTHPDLNPISPINPDPHQTTGK